MKSSSTYQAILEEGRQEGRLDGRHVDAHRGGVRPGVVEALEELLFRRGGLQGRGRGRHQARLELFDGRAAAYTPGTGTTRRHEGFPLFIERQDGGGRSSRGAPPLPGALRTSAPPVAGRPPAGGRPARRPKRARRPLTFIRSRGRTPGPRTPARCSGKAW